MSTNPNNNQPGTGIIPPPIAMPPAVPHDAQQAMANERLAHAQAAAAAAMGYPGQGPGIPYLANQAHPALAANHPSVQRQRQAIAQSRIQPPPPPPPPPMPAFQAICQDESLALKMCRLDGFGIVLIAETAAGAVSMSFVPQEAGVQGQ